MLYFLPENIKIPIQKLNLSFINEIRLRKNNPIIVYYKFKSYYLTENGKSALRKNAILCTENDINKIISIVCENSVYAFNDRIKEGYLTTRNGVRIGLAGQCVFDKGKIVTIKNIESLNLRIPHDVKNCSNDIYYSLFTKKIYNTLIISPPGKGKTTIIKDLALKLNTKKINVLLIDERGEMNNVKGDFIDKIEYCNKSYAFNYGIRSMSPNVVIMDELSSLDDWHCALTAVNSGVKLIATAHADSIETISNKNFFIKGVFERYVILKSEGNAGIIENIYNEDLSII